MGKPLFTTTQFINAIPGSGGIITTIAERVGCSWNTAKHYIDAHPTVKAAYTEERERITDMCEVTLIRSIQNAHKAALAGGFPDMSDVKWYLARKGKDRGYVERQEVTGAEGNEVIFKVIRE